MQNYTTKYCPKCKQDKPATSEYWYQDASRADGLQAICKKCRSEAKKKKRQDNPEWAQEEDRKSRIKFREKRIQQKREWYQQNKDRVRDYDLANRDKRNAQRRERRESNPEKTQLERKKYYNLDTIYKWRAKNPSKVIAIRQRRRARKLNLPDTFTSEQWVACLEYFNYCCAVCGVQLRDLFGNVEPHADHWIPLVSPECLGTVAENMVCLCNHCNHTKQALLPDIWLERTYSKAKAKQILERVEMYFKTVKQT